MSAQPLPAEAVARASSVKGFVVAGELRIPGWVTDLTSFRRWACPENYPRHGWVSFLNGEIWVDLSREEFYTHNQVKGEFAFAIMTLLRQRSRGRFIHDRMLFTNTEADLSTEPDGMFFLWKSQRSGKIRVVEGAEEGYMEIEGSPDMILEVVSKSSVDKDTQTLLQQYWQASIREYWLVDVRSGETRFDIFRYTKKGYVPSNRQGGWLKSKVFGKSFRLTRKTDPLGQPLFRLRVK